MGDKFLESILERETPVVMRRAYNLLQEEDQAIIDKKVKHLTVSYILISNSNNKRLHKHLEDLDSIGSDVFYRT